MIAGTGLSVSSGTVAVSYGTSSTSACVGNDVRLARAWVNFDGTAASNLTGTYSRSGTTVTCTVTAHGLSVNQQVYLDFTTGLAVDGTFSVATVADANTFTVTHGTSGTTSGNVTVVRNAIQSQSGVSSIADKGVGLYSVNLSSAISDNHYAAVVHANSDFAAPTFAYEDGGLNTRTTLVFQIAVVNSSFALVDRSRISVVFFR